MRPAEAAIADEWPPDSVERVESCPVCGHGGRHLLYADLRDRSYRSAPGSWSLFRCDACACAYLDARPDERTAPIAYRTYYDGPSGVQAEHGTHAGQHLRRSIRNGYLNAKYGYHLEPALRAGRFVVPCLPRHREQADERVRHLRLPKSGGRILDVGCGEGAFLSEMQALGWSVQGIDVSGDAVATARSRGVPATCGVFSVDALEPDSFDAITFRLVLEHLRDPVSELIACRRALRTGGVLWIATPNLDSEAHRVFGRNWMHLEPPRHAVIYRAPALTRLLIDLGFQVVAVRPVRHARWSFRMSEALARGLSPFENAPSLSPARRLSALLADLKALRDPTAADIILVIAHAA